MSTWAGPPKWYARGRVRAIQVIVVHNTQGNEGPTKAEAGVAYDKIRLDSVSCHCFADSEGAALEEVRDTDTAYHARNHGNAIGWGLELCGLSEQSPAQWQDATSQATLRTAAAECAARVRKWGWLRSDIRRLTVAQTRAAYYAPVGQRPRGFCGHVEITAAFPEDGGTHWDPGPNFPWAQFLGMVRAAYDGEETGDDEMAGYAFRVDGGDPNVWWFSDGIRRRRIPAGGYRGTLDTKGVIKDIGVLPRVAGDSIAENEEGYGGPIDSELGGGGAGDGVTEAEARAIANEEIAEATVTTTITPSAPGEEG